MLNLTNVPLILRVRWLVKVYVNHPQLNMLSLLNNSNISLWNRFSHEDNVIWTFHIRTSRIVDPDISLQKKHRLLWKIKFIAQTETLSLLYLLSPICVYVFLFHCLILFKLIMTMDNYTADRQKRRRERYSNSFPLHSCCGF